MQNMSRAGKVGNVWSFNFFFYNRKLKRILYFACCGRSRAAANSSANEQSTGAYNSDEEVSHRMSHRHLILACPCQHLWPALVSMQTAGECTCSAMHLQGTLVVG